MVCGRSKGSRWYIFPPGKWQGWQCCSRIGRISDLKSAAGRLAIIRWKKISKTSVTGGSLLLYKLIHCS